MTVGNSTFSIGKDVVFKMSMTGSSSVHTVKIMKALVVMNLMMFYNKTNQSLNFKCLEANELTETFTRLNLLVVKIISATDKVIFYNTL